MPAILIMTKKGKFIPYTDVVERAGNRGDAVQDVRGVPEPHDLDHLLMRYTNKRVRTDEVLDEVFYEMGPTSKRVGTDKFLKSWKYAHASTTVNAIMSTEAVVNPAALPFGYVFTIDTSGKYEYVIADTNRSADRQLDSRLLQ
ncbi:hypothetical protein LTR17_027608 [Elasticomyces elasticus]|nr:hypothetical protein LTR17_027608 [Elasticomyces elasticus]